MLLKQVAGLMVAGAGIVALDASILAVSTLARVFGRSTPHPPPPLRIRLRIGHDVPVPLVPPPLLVLAPPPPPLSAGTPPEPHAAAMPAPDDAPPDDAPDTSKPAPRARRAAQSSEATDAEAGLFTFRDTLLEKLKDYMFYVGRMKAVDRDAYDLYSKLGAILLPDGAIIRRDNETLSPWFRDTTPAFGAVAMVSRAVEQRETKAADGRYVPRFMYFRKFAAAPPHVEQFNGGAYYIITVYFDWRSDPKKRGLPVEIPILVTDGHIRVLRHRLMQAQHINHRQGYNRGYSSSITHKRWGFHKIMHQWAAETDCTIQQVGERLFLEMANAFSEANASMIRVAASKDRLTATFGVDVTRTPAFFADREPVFDARGRKARIFHIVRVHVRGDGAAVKTHFRGTRRFVWHGYDIHISVPGLHHADPKDFAMGSIEWDMAEKGIRYADNREIATLLAKHIADGRPMRA